MGFRVTVEEEGNGFNWRAVPDPNMESLLFLNGRGIFLTRIYYDEVIYDIKVNCVTLVKNPSL